MALAYEPEALGMAIRQSRDVIPHAVDVLCELIEEVTGVMPDRAQVEYVSLFWLMHTADQVVYEQGAGDTTARSIDIPGLARGGLGDANRRSRIIAHVGSRDAAVRVTDPYLKIAFREEASSAFAVRRQMRWDANLTPQKWSVAVNTVAREHVAERSAVKYRNDSSSANTSERLFHALRTRIARSAPIALVEQFHHLSTWATSTVDPTVRVWYTANAHQSSVAFRYRMHAQRQHGTVVAIHQHGGGYGTDEHHLGEEHDIAISDVFYTFGWNRPDCGSRVRALATAMPRRSADSSPHGYVLMSLPVTQHVYRFQAFLMPSHIVRAVEETVSFANALEAGVDVRVRSSGTDVFPMDRLHASRARITQDDAATGPIAALRAKLVIHNYVGTSWLETLAMNIPTVCFIPVGVHRFRAAAQPFADELVRVGILHYSGSDAAKFVNSFRGDPTSWWSSAEVQEAREHFVARYANFSHDWLPAWRTEFERLLDEGASR